MFGPLGATSPEGSPDLVVAALTVVDPLVAVSLGIGLLGAARGAPWWACPVFAVAEAVAVFGVVRLSRHPTATATATASETSRPPAPIGGDSRRRRRGCDSYGRVEPKACPSPRGGVGMRFFRIIGTGAVSTALVVAVTLPAQAATVPYESCMVSVAIPTTLVIRSWNTTFPATLTDASGCASTASWSIVAGTVDTNSSASFDSPNTVDQVDFSTGPSGSHAGSYQAVSSFASSDDEYVDADGTSHSVTVQQQTSNTMVAKYASRLAWTALTRTSTRVRIGVSAKAWSPFVAFGGYTAWKGAQIAVQKRIGTTWRTVKTITTDKHGAASATITSSVSAWRLKAADASSVWGSVTSMRNR